MKVKKYIFKLLYSIFGIMIIYISNFHIYDYKCWLIIVGEVGLYAIGRYEALYEKEQ